MVSERALHSLLYLSFIVASLLGDEHAPVLVVLHGVDVLGLHLRLLLLPPQLHHVALLRLLLLLPLYQVQLLVLLPLNQPSRFRLPIAVSLKSSILLLLILLEVLVPPLPQLLVLRVNSLPLLLQSVLLPKCCSQHLILMLLYPVSEFPLLRGSVLGEKVKASPRVAAQQVVILGAIQVHTIS